MSDFEDIFSGAVRVPDVSWHPHPDPFGLIHRTDLLLQNLKERGAIIDYERKNSRVFAGLMMRGLPASTIDPILALDRPLLHFDIWDREGVQFVEISATITSRTPQYREYVRPLIMGWMEDRGYKLKSLKMIKSVGDEEGVRSILQDIANIGKVWSVYMQKEEPPTQLPKPNNAVE